MTTDTKEPETLAEGDAIATRLIHYINLYRKRKAAQKIADEFADQIKAIEPNLIEDMALRGITSANIDGACVYRRTDVYPGRKSGASNNHMLAALAESGLDFLLTVNWQVMRGWINEQRTAEHDLPTILESVIELRETHKLCVRGA